jgi:HPt (histidine-containing phosphotransfer) domain-containing protein
MARSETGNMADPAMGDSPVDLAALARLMGRSDPALINQMLALFWQTEAETPLTLRRLTLARDGNALAAAAHGAKGAAFSVGATRVAHLCLALESCAKNDDWDAVTALTAEVEQAYSEVGAFIASTLH